jgi:MFS family permease
MVPLRHVAARASHEEQERQGRGSYRDVLRQRALPTMLVVTFLGSFVGYAQLNTGMPAFARELGKVSTQGLGLAFAANTLVIVLLQLLVLQRIEGRRRTRVISVMAAIWAAAWLCMGASGLVPGTIGATLLIAACASVFALGETLLQPTVPAMTNDLTSDRLRGRTNALSSAAFQLPMVVAPPVSGFLIGHHLGAAYIALLVAGCALVVFLVRVRLEPQLSGRANGIHDAEAAAEVEAPAAVLTGPAVATPAAD